MPTSSTPSSFQIDRLKITGYLLNIDSPQGGPKAKYFLNYGFTPHDPDTFGDALLRHARTSPVESRSVDRYGTKIVFRGKLHCPNGVTGRDVLSIWQVPPGSTEARLVSAYPG